MATRKTSRGVKTLRVKVYKCKDLKAALAKELRAHVKDRTILNRLVDRLGGEVAYGSGGGGGIGVA